MKILTRLPEWITNPDWVDSTGAEKLSTGELVFSHSRLIASVLPASDEPLNLYIEQNIRVTLEYVDVTLAYVHIPGLSEFNETAMWGHDLLSEMTAALAAADRECEAVNDVIATLYGDLGREFIPEGTPQWRLKKVSAENVEKIRRYVATDEPTETPDDEPLDVPVRMTFTTPGLEPVTWLLPDHASRLLQQWAIDHFGSLEDTPNSLLNLIGPDLINATRTDTETTND